MRAKSVVTRSSVKRDSYTGMKKLRQSLSCRHSQPRIRLASPMRIDALRTCKSAWPARRAKIGLVKPPAWPSSRDVPHLPDGRHKALNQAKDQPPNHGLDRSNRLLRLGLAPKPRNQRQSRNPKCPVDCNRQYTSGSWEYRYRSPPLGPSNLNAHRQRRFVGHETSLSGARPGTKVCTNVPRSNSARCADRSIRP
jgi:hypothetical protein